MNEKGKTNKDQLKERWQETYEALSQLEDLHVWPTDKDVAQLEDELVRELAIIEHQLSQDLQKWAPGRDLRTACQAYAATSVV